MSNELVALAILSIACMFLLLAMIYQTCQVRELYKMFSAKVDADNYLKWEETKREER